MVDGKSSRKYAYWPKTVWHHTSHISFGGDLHTYATIMVRTSTIEIKVLMEVYYFVCISTQDRLSADAPR